MSAFQRISGFSIMLLVVLRVALGWHFFYEGWTKYNSPTFTARGYLSQAKGPLAKHFEEQLPDPYGFNRLDVEALGKAWTSHANLVSAHYGFDEDQQERATALVDQALEEVRQYIAENEDPDTVSPAKVERYVVDLKAWLKQRDANGFKPPKLPKEEADERARLRQMAAPWLAKIDQIDTQVRYDVMAVATPKQVDSLGGYKAPRTRLDWIDLTTMYGLMAIGLGLMAGLFTRLASLSAGVFLMMVVLSQPALPWVYPHPPLSSGSAYLVNKEFIEMLLMFFLATTRVGRWGGLDFFISALFGGLTRSKEEKRLS